MSPNPRVPDGCDAVRLVDMLSETLLNLDREHAQRLEHAARSARDPHQRAQMTHTLAARHRERRSPYVEAIARLRRSPARAACGGRASG